MNGIEIHLNFFQILGFLYSPKSVNHWKRVLFHFICSQLIVQHILGFISSFPFLLVRIPLLDKLSSLFQVVTLIRGLGITFTILAERSKLQQLFTDFQRFIDGSELI